MSCTGRRRLVFDVRRLSIAPCAYGSALVSEAHASRNHSAMSSLRSTTILAAG